MRISVNLATRPFTDHGPALKQLRIGMAVLAVLSGAFWLGIHLLGGKADAARQRERTLDGAVARLNQERQDYENQLHLPDNSGVLAQADTLNKLFDAKSFSWTLTMEDLETVLPGGVQAVSLEPVRGKDGTITLHLRVLGPRDRAVTLIQNLEHSHRFLHPRIVNVTAETGNGPAERLEPVSMSSRANFDLLADYNPATPEERKAVLKKSPAPSTEQSTQQPAPFRAGPGALRPPYAGTPCQPKGGPQ